jgi:predicted amidohydrolase YtcJ
MQNSTQHTIIPGLHDSHLHVIRGGRLYNFNAIAPNTPVFIHLYHLALLNRAALK